MSKAAHPKRSNNQDRSTNLQTLDITVLAGGPSDEREVSLASGRAIACALERLGHRVTQADIAPDDLSALNRPADLVFIALHGEFGEDGTVQRELERRGIRYTGANSAASALAMDKVKTKARLIENSLPTPRFDVARNTRISQILERWRLPVVVKPVHTGSSIDTYLIYDPVRFRDAVGDVVQKYGEALIEELVEGPELTVSVVGDTALPVIEIRTARAFYDYQAKYIDEDTEYLFEIDLPDSLLSTIRSQSVQASHSLDCRDFCRVDWMVDRITHEAYILEVNSIPGFTSHSLLPKAAARAGMSFDDVCQRIVELAFSRSET